LISSATITTTTTTKPTIDYEEIEAIIFEWIERSTCPDPADSGAANHWDWNTDDQDCDLFPRRRGANPLGPRLIRHAFHDAAGISDGFVDLTNPDNAGLESSDRVLNLIYSDPTLLTFTDGGSISEVLNMADFAAWSYVAALRFTAMRQGGGNAIVPDIPITIGRQPFAGPQPPNEILPAGHFNGQNVEAYFAEVFQFSPEETTAIMGAHTLGGAGRAESGYAGPWTPRRNVFDNEYYGAIIFPRSADPSCPSEGPITLDPASRCNGWEVRQIISATGRKFQWSHSCNPDGTECVQMMLHADMGLFKDIDEFICTAADAAARTHDCQVEGQVSPAAGAVSICCTHCFLEYDHPLTSFLIRPIDRFGDFLILPFAESLRRHLASLPRALITNQIPVVSRCRWIYMRTRPPPLFKSSDLFLTE
jgi:hypothetical protein